MRFATQARSCATGSPPASGSGSASVRLVTAVPPTRPRPDREALSSSVSKTGPRAGPVRPAAGCALDPPLLPAWGGGRVARVVTVRMLARV